MAKQKSRNIEKTLHSSVEKLISNDIKKEMGISQLKDRLKEAVAAKAVTRKSINQTPGLKITNNVLKQSGKQNKDSVSAIMDKIKDYLSYKDNSNPEYPNQNNSKTDHNSPMYRNSTDQEEYVEEWRGGGLEDLQYQTEPSDEFKERFSQYLDGSIETGNNDGEGSDGQQVANVVPSKLGEKIKKTMKRKHKALQGDAGDAIPNDWAHHSNPGYMGESNEKKGKLISEQTMSHSGKDNDGNVTKITKTKASATEEDKIKAIEKIQQYCKISVDGKVGPETSECIERIQKENGLTINGKLSKELFKLVAKGLKENNNKDNITESVSYDMEGIKHLFNYNKKTQ
jgi:uncharacterized protein YoaH (UPF0181 family)|tara:strand:- start:2107 stop:3132 length:1026 start_codon:yes stop_codon:yes gene_type:complete